MFKHAISLFISGCFLAGAAAQEEKLKELKGAIRALDLKIGTLTLQQLQTEKQHPLSLAAKDLPVVDTLGRPLKLGDLRPELRVTAKIRNEADIVSLRVDGPYLNGQIKSVDADARSITFKDVFAVKTMHIPASAPIVVNGKDGAFEQLKAGAPVQLLLSLDRKTILQVQIGKGVNIRDPYLRILRHYGILAELDHAKRTVQIFEQAPDSGILKTYEVSADAYLRTMYHLMPVREVGFEQFAKLVKVYYTIDRDTGRLINIDADLPVMVRRKVLKFEAATRRLTIEDERAEKTLELAADVKVWTPKGDGKLADVSANRIVNCGLSLDRSKVQLVYLWDR